MKTLSCLLGLLLFCMSAAGWAETQASISANSDAAVMQQFVSHDAEEMQRISDKNRHQILFFMGVTLLILIIITVSLGVAMVIYRKKVFVAHMLFAGLSLTLAMAHAVVAMVWFFPF